VNAGAAAFWGAVGASSLLVGAVRAMVSRPSSRTLGLVMGVRRRHADQRRSYELVPQAAKAGWQAALGLGIGALTYFVGDSLVSRGGGADRKRLQGKPSLDSAGMAIFLGTLLDGIPESLILGMSLALGGSVSVAFLAAVFLSNLPEAMAATASLETAGDPQGRIFGMWLSLLVASAVAAVLGYVVVSNLSQADGAFAQAFAAGAMLTMLADTMMPEAFEHGGRAVGLVTVLGFVLFVLAAALSAAE
jgi:ZIP family zinc transporter